MSKFPDSLAEALYELSIDGPDEQTGSVQENGIWYGLLIGVGPEELIEAGAPEDELPEEKDFILSEDDQGFVDYESFSSAEEAAERFEELRSEIEDEHPQPEDIVIEDLVRGGYSVGIVDGKHIGNFNEYDDALRAVKKWMEKEKFWPNVWTLSDHGNYNLLSENEI